MLILLGWILIILGLIFIGLGIDTYLRSRGAGVLQQTASNKLFDLIVKWLGWLLNQPGGGWIVTGIIFIAVGGHILGIWDLIPIFEVLGSVDEEALRLLFSV